MASWTAWALNGADTGQLLASHISQRGSGSHLEQVHAHTALPQSESAPHAYRSPAHWYHADHRSNYTHDPLHGTSHLHNGSAEHTQDTSASLRYEGQPQSHEGIAVWRDTQTLRDNLDCSLASLPSSQRCVTAQGVVAPPEVLQHWPPRDEPWTGNSSSSATPWDVTTPQRHGTLSTRAAQSTPGQVPWLGTRPEAASATPGFASRFSFLPSSMPPSPALVNANPTDVTSMTEAAVGRLASLEAEREELQAWLRNVAASEQVRRLQAGAVVRQSPDVMEKDSDLRNERHNSREALELRTHSLEEALARAEARLRAEEEACAAERSKHATQDRPTRISAQEAFVVSDSQRRHSAPSFKEHYLQLDCERAAAQAKLLDEIKASSAHSRPSTASSKDLCQPSGRDSQQSIRLGSGAHESVSSASCGTNDPSEEVALSGRGSGIRTPRQAVGFTRESLVKDLGGQEALENLEKAQAPMETLPRQLQQSQVQTGRNSFSSFRSERSHVEARRHTVDLFELERRSSCVVDVASE
eukprot:TRINITY_DN58209_c0_g1_i1.p1 TRINITY_DN58209_c0_g1~~TRINITY_DN58209_c0_g1_i1.p1  ORF type:complete len:528 (-),score=67.40 TRINITY_DN58209_c0_g1_i1:19-1602(-)